MTNMKKTFFNKLLLATSSIGLLASAESFAAVVVPVPFYANNTSYLLDPMDARERPQDWRSNNGNRNYQPQNGDSIIFKGAHLINLNKTINIDEINIYGYAPRDLVDNYHNGINDPREMGGIAITSGFNDDTIVTINNIINSNANNYHIAGSNALGQALVYGNKNAKVRIDLLESAKNVKLIITGNISAVDSMVMSGGTNEIIFQRPIKVNTKIYARNTLQGKVKIESNNIVFESPIGNDGRDNHSISIFKVDDNISVTLENNIVAEDINLGKNSTVIIDANKRNIDVRSGIVVNNAVDNQGILQVRGHAKNTVTFYENIGVQDFRAAEIQIENGKKTEFKQNVYAKKITVASNDVVFEEKLDMAQYNQNNRGNRTNLIHTGNLEFTNRGKVKFNKDYVGTITTSKANIGEVTFVNTPNIYEVGAVNKRIEKLTFTGNHVRNLRKNIYANQVNFDAGTYNVHTNPVTINGNTKINGSTFDLRRDLILNGDVEFSGNITFNVTGGCSVFFQNNLYSVAGTNIIISVNGVHPVDAVSALSIFRVNGGAFIPEGHNYNPATGTMNFRNGLQVQQAGQAAAQEVAQQQVRVNSQTQAMQAQAQQAQAQVQALQQQQQQKQAQVQAFTQQRDQAQAQVPVLAQQRAVERARVQADTERLRQQMTPHVQIINDRFATALEKQQAQAQIDLLQQQQDALQAPADALNQQRLQVQNQARGFEQQRVQASRQLQGLAQQQQQVQADAAAEQQVQNAHAQVLAQELVQGQGRAAQAQLNQQGQGQAQQNQQGQGQAQQQVQQQGQGQGQAQQNQQGQGQAQQNQQQVQQQNQQQQQAQAQREANERARQQRLQAEREENARREQQQQQQEEERRNENERLAQQEANERAIAEENNRRIEEQRLQAEYQQRQANEIRVAEEYVKKPESQKLAEAINNTIVAHTENTFVAEVQKEVIREKSALVMKNPEKHAVELAKELINNKAELKEVAKVANDDTVVVSKTKQEQSLLFVANLAQVAPDNAKKVVEHLTEQGTRSVSVANVTAEAVTANINNHLSGGTMIAVAAGDEETPIITKKGLWVAGTFGSSTQDAYKGNPSYKGTVSGGTIGGDLYIGENSLVGLAYSRMNSDFKFKGSSTGDKLSAESDIISLYGQQQFSNGLILQEIFSASNSKINKKDLRPVGPNSYKTASGKYTSKAYGFEGNVGYQFSPVDGINLMPNIGIRYNTYKDNAYTETGTGVNNMYVAGKSGNLTTGIAGIKLTAPKRLSDDTQIVPGLHASVENSFSNKQPKVKARFIWADNYFENTTSSSTPKVGYNVGASLLTAHKNIELLATYNCNLRSKYTSHQGSLKLKILF